MSSTSAYRALAVAAVVALVGSLVSCKKVPKEIIQPEQMAQLMADVHTGESVVEMNRGEYPTDSSKIALKLSIYKRHGVTSAQVDSSFMWYGRNIDRYMQVYDRTIEILNERLAEKGNLIAAEAAMSVSGDSVDVWTYPRCVMYTDRMPSPFITFSIPSDPNWEPGDSYTWRMKMELGGIGSTWQLLGDYEDGTTEVINASIMQNGWTEITFRADTTKTLRRIYGNLMLTNNSHGYRNDDRKDSNVWIDSLTLMRNRIDRNRYGQRYRQRIYEIKQ